MSPQIPPVFRADPLIDHILRDIDAELGFNFEEDFHHVEFIDGGIDFREGDFIFILQACIGQFALCRGSHPIKRLRVSSRSAVARVCGGFNMRCGTGCLAGLRGRPSPPEQECGERQQQGYQDAFALHGWWEIDFS
jgi:hypothetical protein